MLRRALPEGPETPERSVATKGSSATTSPSPEAGSADEVLIG
jgi:hypothetical protein